MARSKQTARKSTGAPRKQLERKRDRVNEERLARFKRFPDYVRYVAMWCYRRYGRTCGFKMIKDRAIIL